MPYQETLEEGLKEFDELVFDFHIRGCTYTESPAQKICKSRQNELRLFLTSFAEKIRESVVGEILSTEPSPQLDVYLDKVKNGNKDDMYDYGVKVERERILAQLKDK